METAFDKKKPGKAIIGYTTGIKTREFDLEKRKREKKYREDEALLDKTKERGSAEFIRPYIPTWQKTKLTPREMQHKMRKEAKERFQKKRNNERNH